MSVSDNVVYIEALPCAVIIGKAAEAMKKIRKMQKTIFALLAYGLSSA
jgi:hypothetical protein